MRLAGLPPEEHLVLGEFFHSETHEEFVAFIGMYEPFIHGLCPRQAFDGKIGWPPQPAPSTVKAVPGLYRHFKGRTYKAFGEFTHVLTGEVFVAYVGLYPMSAMLARPKSNFLEHVDRADYDYHGPRFTLVRPC